jgi:drug/metabolite transporter (DMT)-like permease
MFSGIYNKHMINKRHNKALGTVSVLGASIMWAIEPILAKLSYQSADFMNTFAMRTVFAFIIITVYVLVFKTKYIIVKRQFLPKLIFLSIAATLFADLMYIYALTRVPVVNAVLIGHMQPIFVVLFGYCVLKQDVITKFDYLGIMFMIIAGIMVTTKTLGNLLGLRFGTLGDIYVLSATIAWATTAIIARKYLKPLDAGVIAFYRFLFAGIIFISYSAVFHDLNIHNIYQVLLGFTIGVGTILYYEGIRLIKAAQVSALELATPFFATLLGYLVLREIITIMQFIGILLLLVGIYFLARKETSQ